jgi:DNA uptake protein ComE-like DNA-binding protein
MIRVIDLRKSLTIGAVAVAACTAKPDNQADTTMTVTDSSMASSTTVSPSTATPSTTMGSSTTGRTTTGGSTASSTGAIVPININTATDAQILAIPGMGPRMLREFKEYRPYTSIEQFRREIGKYVDKAEVARFEQYIVIK